MDEEQLAIHRQRKADYMREYTRKNAEKINAQRRARRAENPEHYRQIDNAHYRANIDREREAKRRDYAKHRDERREWHREYHAEHAEECRQKARDYYARNPDRWVKYRAENKEHINNATRRRRAENPDKVREWKRADWQRHADEYREKCREWYRNNRERAYANGHQRRAKLRNSGGTYTKADIESLLQAQGGKCAGCDCRFTKSRPFTRDHVVPVKSGGTNSVDNLQLLCRSCNAKKGAISPEAWAAEIGKLFV